MRQPASLRLSINQYWQEKNLSHPEELKHLNAEITSHMAHLGKCLIYVLSLYVLGMVVMQHCGQSRIATFLSGLMGCSFGAMKQRLREFTYESECKQGECRQEIEVKTCFAPLLSWVLSKFRGQHKQLVLAMDATYLKDRFVILAISVVVAGCAIPVAWHIQRGSQKGEWNPIWFALLDLLQPSIPDNWQVFILTDSGLYSKGLFQYLDLKQWIAFMRINWTQGLFQVKGCSEWLALSDLVQKGMSPLALEGRCFKTHPIDCSLILQWEAVYEQPCLLVSNLVPDQIEANVYAIRYWIECGFKDVKRGFFHWEQTKMTCPQRAERLWLVISIALLWLTCLGEAASDAPQWHSLSHARPKARILSAPLLGWIDLIVRLLQGQGLTFGYLNPYPWLPLPEE
jgi:hypothetical protein